MRRDLIIKIVLVGLVMTMPAVVNTSADVFEWVGQLNSSDSNFSTVENWDPNDNYPDDEYDVAIVDDPTYYDGVVTIDVANLTIYGMFVGDGHTIELEEELSVGTHDPEPGSGWVEFDGIVTLSDSEEEDGDIDCVFVLINTTQRTTVTFTDSTSAGCLYTDPLADACSNGG